MSDPDFGELIVRMVVSLAVILAVLAVAYTVLRRRPGMIGAAAGGMGRSARPARERRPRRSPLAGRDPGRGRAASTRPALRVLGRTGVGRSSTLVAVMFGDEVLLVGANDADAPTVLSRTTLEGWERAVEREAAAGDRAVPLPVDPAHRRPSPAPRSADAIGPDHRAATDHGRHESRRPRPDTMSAAARPDGHQVDARTASLSLIEALRDATARRH